MVSVPWAQNFKGATIMADNPERVWKAKNLGSGTFVITKPKRNKAKMRLHRLKNTRRAR
jgi:hypothetical protein